MPTETATHGIEPDAATTAPALRGVCLLATDIDAPTGGLQRQSRLLLEGLARQGVAGYVCTRNYSHRKRNELCDNVVYHRSPVLARGTRIVNSLCYLVDTLGWLIRNRRCYDIIHCQQLFGSAMVAMFARRLLGKPVVIRSTTAGTLSEPAALAASALGGWRVEQVRRADAFVALTAAMKEELVAVPIMAEKIRVIHNGTSIPSEASYRGETRATCRCKLGLVYKQMVIYSGRLSSEKNLDVLLSCWPAVRAACPEAHLLLLGSGGAYRSVESDLKDLARGMSLDGSVHFLGHVPNPMDYLLASDAFVLPTSTEGMSNSLVEALACGTAIVATDIPANRELLEEGKNALLVPIRDQNALATALNRILGDAALGSRLAAAGRELAEQDLSADTMVARYLALYREVIAAHGRRPA